MKILILALCISLFSTLGSQLYSQGNLQFNQVKLVSTVETVPAGKVWKVENSTYQGGAPICLAGSVLSGCDNINGSPRVYGLQNILINGNSNYINIISQGANAGGSAISASDFFPIWLPAGTTLAAGTNTRYLSIIEFNIIP